MAHRAPVIRVFGCTSAEVSLVDRCLPADCVLRVAATPQSLLEELAGSEPATGLIFLGTQAWQVNPEDLMSRIKSHPVTRTIPVLVVLPDAQGRHLKRTLTLGAADVIRPPLDPDLLQLRLRTHIGLWSANRMLEKVLDLDSLTRLPTAQRFNELLADEWRRAMRLQTPLSLMLMEIDGFAEILKAHGESAGDECLYRMAEVLRSTFTRSADNLARLQRGRFAAVLPETDAIGASAVAEKTHAAIRELDLWVGTRGSGLQVTMSLGMATIVPTAGVEAKALKDLAQEMLSMSRAEGRNGFRCSPAC